MAFFTRKPPGLETGIRPAQVHCLRRFKDWPPLAEERAR